MFSSAITQLPSLRTSSHQIPAFASFPNTSLLGHPLIIYHSAFSPASATATSVEKHLRKVGVVEPRWRYTMYRQHHYHSTTHEVLVVTNGGARLCFGGPPEKANQGRVEVRVRRGDVMIVPAGVSHALVEDEGGFEMVGSYPKEAESWDMCTGQEEERGEAWDTIRGLKWFEKDLIYGDEGPVLSSKDDKE
ncbi:hypothetical protein B9479_006724 [Cryptococcus floricola]|uniref:Cupin type-1 domain-containing protein n=1 Tax=Cryptococcus floricola TaxID=2591691 RepID=A0A5D3AMF8_9TREE|nr:hypothetical protein B9479_006724 [Cryptococcus floricola]